MPRTVTFTLLDSPFARLGRRADRGGLGGWVGRMRPVVGADCLYVVTPSCRASSAGSVTGPGQTDGPWGGWLHLLKRHEVRGSLVEHRIRSGGPVVVEES